MTNEFVRSDPALNILYKLFHEPRRMYFAALVLNLFILLIGLYYSFKFGSQRVVTVWEAGALVQGISVGFLASPCIWVFALWHPLALAKIEDDLQTKAVIAKTVTLSNSPHGKRASLSDLLQDSVTRKLWSLLALLATIVGVWIFSQIIIPNETMGNGGRPSVFYALPALTFIYLVYFTPHIYLIAVTILRTLATVFVFAKFFSRPGAVARISIFDPDQSGGFGSIGQFSVGVGLMAVIIGWVTATTTFFPVILGGQANISAAITVSVFYIVLVPLCVLFPIWSAHLAMVAYRDGVIKKLSASANKTLKKMPGKLQRDSENVMNSLNKLEEMHGYIMRNTPTWPLRLLAMRGFSIAAVLPVVFNVISIWLTVSRRGTS